MPGSPSPIRRVVAITLCACLALSSSACAPLALASKRLQARPAGSPPTRDTWITREYAEKLPVGTKVKVERRDGKSFTATFMGVEGDAVRLQRRTRIPEPPIVIPLSELAVLAVDDRGGGGAVKNALVGAAVGAGTFFFLLLLAAAAWDD